MSSIASKATLPRSTLMALGAIALWASLASLGVALAHLPPFLLTGLALLIGSIPAWPRWREWRVRPGAFLLGLYALFGFHFLLFIALRIAPPLEVNLVNYLWPLLIVVMAPLWLPGVKLRPVHWLAALLGFAGAVLAMLGGRSVGGGLSWGYLLALGSAFIWASYSLTTRRWAEQGQGFPTAAVGLFGLGSGVLSLLCHLALEPVTLPSLRDLALLAVMGLGPLGTAFMLWDKALKHGDPRTIGVLSYLTPLGSTALLALTTGRAVTASLAVAAVMVVGAALLALRSN